MTWSPRPASGRATFGWVPWIAVALLAAFSLTQLGSRASTRSDGSEARPTDPPIVPSTPPAPPLDRLVAFDDEVLAAFEAARQSDEALVVERRSLAVAREAVRRLEIERDALRAAAAAAAADVAAASRHEPIESPALSAARARIEALEAALASAGASRWRDVNDADPATREAAIAALVEGGPDEARLIADLKPSTFARSARFEGGPDEARFIADLGSDNREARRAARALLLAVPETPRRGLAAAALAAASRWADSALFDAIGPRRAFQAVARDIPGEVAGGSGPLLAWTAGRAPAWTSEERTAAVETLLAATSDDRTAALAWRLLARIEPARVLAAQPGPYDGTTPAAIVEALARLDALNLPAGTEAVAARAFLASDPALRRAAAVVLRRVAGERFDGDPAASAAAREAAVLRLGAPVPR